MPEIVPNELWETITGQKRLYRLRETQFSTNTTFDFVLRLARETADSLRKPIHIDVFFEEQWYQIDVAYPVDYSVSYPQELSSKPYTSPSHSRPYYSQRSTSHFRVGFKCPKCGSFKVSETDTGACHCWNCSHSWHTE